MHALRLACVLSLSLILPAVADVAERDQAWDALVAAAKEHGGQETRLDRSSSFVFQREDGSYLTVTRMLETAKGRSVCLIAKGLSTTACVDWETGKLRLGRRKDAAAPWKFSNFESLDAFEAAKPGFVEKFDVALNWLLHAVASAGYEEGNECWGVARNGIWYHVNKSNC